MLSMKMAMGDPTFDALRGGLPNDDQRNYFHNLYQNAVGFLDEGRRAFVEKTRNTYQTLTNSEAAKITRKLKRAFTGAYRSGIEMLESIEDFQDCKPAMQRWLVSHPTVNKYIEDGVCEGYGLDLDAKERDLRWKAIDNGVLHIPEEGKPYYDAQFIMETDEFRLPNANEQHIMNKLHTRLIAMLEDGEGEDPTSQYGGELG